MIEITEVDDYNKDGKEDLGDIEYLLRNNKNTLTILDGDGDFRSEECVEFLKEADIVVTNPPFSLFREYVSQLMKYNKKFVILGNNNAITYKEIFPLIKQNKIWLGYNNNKTIEFRLSNDYTKWNRIENGVKYGKVPAISWYTNLEIEKRSEKMILYKKYNSSDYPTYDNFDAIEVSKVNNIPEDYENVMGVPITFLNNYNPDQFEILGITKTWYGGATKKYPNQIQVSSNGKKTVVSKLNDGATLEVDKPPTGKTYYIVDNKTYVQLYARILIKRRRNNNDN